MMPVAAGARESVRPWRRICGVLHVLRRLKGSKVERPNQVDGKAGAWGRSDGN
jgi:hypothetical protein